MYDADRYLGGHISFTEPLGAGAGEALTMIRDALVAELRDDNGLPDGGLILLSTVPSEWFEDGKEIELRDFPTAYGTISLNVRSAIGSKREILVEHRFVQFGQDGSQPKQPVKISVRIAPPNQKVIDLELDPASPGRQQVRF